MTPSNLNLETWNFCTKLQAASLVELHREGAESHHRPYQGYVSPSGGLIKADGPIVVRRRLLNVLEIEGVTGKDWWLGETKSHQQEILWWSDASPMLEVFRRWLASQVVHLFDASDAVKAYLSTGSPATLRAARDSLPLIPGRVETPEAHAVNVVWSALVDCRVLPIEIATRGALKAAVKATNSHEEWVAATKKYTKQFGIILNSVRKDARHAPSRG